MTAEFIARSEALSNRAAQAAYCAARARFDGMTADAELWEERAARFDRMAADYRARAN